MEVRDLILKNRSYRRFYQSHQIEMSLLRDLVDLARLSSSGANLQPLKYLLSAEPARNARIFATLGWAGYLKDWSGPAEGERPSAYIVMLLDHRISKNPFWDHGIAAQSILLGAVEQGLGGCMFGNVNREELRVLARPRRASGNFAGHCFWKTEGAGAAGSCGRGWRYTLLPRCEGGTLCTEAIAGRRDPLVSSLPHSPK